MKQDIITTISNTLDKSDILEIRKEFSVLLSLIKSNKSRDIILSNRFSSVPKEYLIGEINQILETHTIERTKYYLKRLKKSLTEIKQSKINDLNLNRWKEYDDIITDSLWILNKRDKSVAHQAGNWRNFIPQIPNKILKRKK